MLTTPFNTTYYWKTELLYNNQLEKISKKQNPEKKQNKENKPVS
jgi:hypothetical protein